MRETMGNIATELEARWSSMNMIFDRFEKNLEDKCFIYEILGEFNIEKNVDIV